MESPLHIGMQNIHERTVQFLQVNGADTNLCNNQTISPLISACQNVHCIIVQLPLDKGASVDSFD